MALSSSERVFIKMPDKEVSLNFLKEVLDIGAPEIGYWCEVVSSTDTEQPEYCRVEILVERPDKEEKEHVTLDLEMIKKGIEAMLKEYDPKAHAGGSVMGMTATFGQGCIWLVNSINDGDTTMVDAEVADRVIQYAVFGEVIYS